MSGSETRTGLVAWESSFFSVAAVCISALVIVVLVVRKGRHTFAKAKGVLEEGLQPQDVLIRGIQAVQTQQKLSMRSDEIACDTMKGRASNTAVVIDGGMV